MAKPLSALQGIDEELREVMRDSLFIDAARRDALCAALLRRIDMLAEFVRSRSSTSWRDERSADVVEDIAYSGAQAEEERGQ